MSNATVTVDSLPRINTPEQYEQLIEAHCLPDTTTEIAGVPRHARFEDLTSEQIQGLDAWFGQNGTIVTLEIDTIEMAIAILGATEVEPTQSYNYKRGSGKDAKFYHCARNLHNRKEGAANLGTLDKEGLTYDLANGYFVRGPIGQIDSWAGISSLQHRIKAAIVVFDETGEFPKLVVITQIGYPPQLNAVNDRGKPKDGKDQEFIDETQFRREFCAGVLDSFTGLDYLPENFVAYRDTAAKTLVTVRNNLWSRLKGTGYHPSKRQQPSTREALSMQKCFESVTYGEGEGDALQALIVLAIDSSKSDDGKKLLWANHITPAMASVLIVLASNKDADVWNPGDPIAVDMELAQFLFKSLASASDKGSEGYSSLLREIATIKRAAKKPAGMDKWVFWSLVAATADLDENGDLPEDATYFPAVNKKLIDAVKKGHTTPPIFGGMDCGERKEPTEETEETTEE